MKLTEAMEITGSVTERIQAVDIDLCIHGSSIAVSYKLHDFPATVCPMSIQLPLHLLYIAKALLFLIQLFI